MRTGSLQPVGATPLRWEELDGDFLPEQFTIATAFDRIEVVGDLFAPTRMHRQDLHQPCFSQCIFAPGQVTVSGIPR